MDDLGDIAYQYSFISKPIFKLEIAAQTILEFLLSKFVEAVINYDTEEKVSSVQERMIALISKDYMRIYKKESEGKSEKDNKYMGYTDTMKLVNVNCDDNYLGRIVNVKITDIKTWSLDGEIVDDPK